VSWEKNRASPYYTRSRRVDGRVVRQYCGAADEGALAAVADTLYRLRIGRERRRLKTELARLRESNSACRRFCLQVGLLARVTSMLPAAPGEDGPDLRNDMETVIDEAAERRLFTILRHRVRSAERGGAQALKELREFVREHPDMWDRCQGLGNLVLGRWLDLASGGDAARRVAMEGELDAKRIALSSSSAAATPLGQLLIGRVIICWLQTNAVDYSALEIVHPAPAAANAPSGESTLRLNVEAARLQSAAHDRLLSALQALADFEEGGWGARSRPQLHRR
jgi:hypothetical protein